MGHTSSKYLVTNPSSFATPHNPGASSLVAGDGTTRWRTYDYVIVGGGKYIPSRIVTHSSNTNLLLGTAGCVLASRLSENPETTVILIEAGQRYVSKCLSAILNG